MRKQNGYRGSLTPGAQLRAPQKREPAVKNVAGCWDPRSPESRKTAQATVA